MSDNENDYTSLMMFLVLGSLIISGYTRMFFQDIKKQERIWTNNGKNGIKGPLRTMYKIMIFLSFLAGIYLMYYLTTNPSKNNDIIRHVGILIFLSFSVIWAFKPFLWSSFVLLVVSIGISLIIASIEKEDSLAIAACTVLLIQTFIFDFGIWSL